MTTLTTHQRELLQAILDGKELVGVVSGTPHNPQDLLHAIARQPASLKIKPNTVKRCIPVLKMPAGSVVLTSAVTERESATDKRYNGQMEGDKLAGILHIEIEPVSLKLVHAELEKL